MPELPDVEVFKRYLDATSLHKRIGDVDVRTRDVLDGVSPERLGDSLEGRRFERTARHGKHLLVSIEGGGWLTMHFGMSGRLKYFKDPDDDPPHDRVLFAFSNGFRLAFDDQRKFGRIGLAGDMNRFIEDHGLGPDALDEGFDFEAFRRAMTVRQASIKSALMNQGRVAGIGNVYSDEILFQAGVRPDTPTGDLEGSRLRRVFRSLRHVLETAIERKADPAEMPGSWLTPNRRREGNCPRCGGDLETIKISGQTAYYCPKDQQA